MVVCSLMTFYLQYSALLASPVYSRLPAACEGFLYLSLASLARSYRDLTLTLTLALTLTLTLTLTRDLRLLWQPLCVASRRRGGRGAHGPGGLTLTLTLTLTRTLTLTLTLTGSHAVP